MPVVNVPIMCSPAAQQSPLAFSGVAPPTLADASRVAAPGGMPAACLPHDLRCCYEATVSGRLAVDILALARETKGLLTEIVGKGG